MVEQQYICKFMAALLHGRLQLGELGWTAEHRAHCSSEQLYLALICGQEQ
jgi:hypothetical protein